MFQDLIRRLRALRGQWLAPLGACAFLALAACTPAQVATTVNTTCADIAAMPAAATGTLDAQDPHSAVGVLWADAKSACVNGAPAAGVGVSWGGMIWGELKVIIPQVLPQLIPLLLGLI